MWKGVCSHRALSRWLAETFMALAVVAGRDGRKAFPLTLAFSLKLNETLSPWWQGVNIIPVFKRPDSLDGSMVGDQGFDPFGFSGWVNLKFCREAELKHGRVAMLAFVGTTLFPPPTNPPPSTNQHSPRKRISRHETPPRFERWWNIRRLRRCACPFNKRNIVSFPPACSRSPRALDGIRAS